MRSLVAILIFGTALGMTVVNTARAETNSFALIDGVTCQYNIPDTLDVGPYQINAGTTFNTSITLACRSSIAASVGAKLSSDQYFGGKPRPQVTLGTQKVNYDLFLGLGLNQRNFDTTPYTHTFVFPIANDPAVVLTDNIALVARFPGGQWVPAGKYQDTVTITLDFQLAE
jgi:spore coat protein U-like protein